MQRVCQLVPLLPPYRDAIGIGALKVHNLLLAKGIDSSVITSSNQEASPGVHTVVPRWRIDKFSFIRRRLQDLRLRTVVFHFPSIGYGRALSLTLLPLFLRCYGIRTTLYLHEFTAYTNLGRLRMFLLGLACDRIITADTPILHALRRLYPLKWRTGRLFLLPNGSHIPPSSHRPSAQSDDEPSSSPNRQKKILYFGYVRQGKGIEIMLECLTRNVDLRQAFEFHVAGSSPHSPTVADAELLERIKKAEWMVFHGHLDDPALAKLFDEVDGVLLPYDDGLTERRGSFMAAVAFGKAVITTAPLMPIDGLQHMTNVIYMDSSSAEALAEVLHYVAAMDKNTLETIGARARAWYQVNHSDTVYVHRFLQVLEPRNSASPMLPGAPDRKEAI